MILINLSHPKLQSTEWKSCIIAEIISYRRVYESLGEVIICFLEQDIFELMDKNVEFWYTYGEGFFF